MSEKRQKCTFLKKDGTLCKNFAEPGSNLCSYHIKEKKKKEEKEKEEERKRKEEFKTLSERYVFHKFKGGMGMEMISKRTDIAFDVTKYAENQRVLIEYVKNGYSIHSFAIDSKTMSIIVLIEKK